MGSRDGAEKARERERQRYITDALSRLIVHSYLKLCSNRFPPTLLWGTIWYDYSYVMFRVRL